MKSLWAAAAGTGGAITGEFRAREGTVALAALAHGTTLGVPVEELRGRSVLLATGGQLATALAILELDGVARRMVLCTPELQPAQLEAVASAAAAQAVVSAESGVALANLRRIPVEAHPTPTPTHREGSQATEWILLTSGTTGMPKLVLHTLSSLAGSLPGRTAGTPVWSTFYDIRRYGGLQIYLRAVLSGSTLVLSSAGETPADFLARAGAAQVTHISGTPSHWRRALMSGAAQAINPRYVRLSGEVADQAILDSLRAAYPQAAIAHAFASTEAGVGFEVTDGRAGFPQSLLERGGLPASDRPDLKIAGGTLHIRSHGNGARYLGGGTAWTDAEGYVDTGDLVELSNGRYHFRGRRGGVINVGGLKVYPEEVEAVLNADPRVRMSLVRARRNPITGAVAVADVVLAEGETATLDADRAESLKHELLNACRRALPAHKVPAVLRLVPALEVTEAGKLVRPNA